MRRTEQREQTQSPWTSSRANCLSGCQRRLTSTATTANPPRDRASVVECVQPSAAFFPNDYAPVIVTDSNQSSPSGGDNSQLSPVTMTMARVLRPVRGLIQFIIGAGGTTLSGQIDGLSRRRVKTNRSPGPPSGHATTAAVDWASFYWLASSSGAGRNSQNAFVEKKFPSRVICFAPGRKRAFCQKGRALAGASGVFGPGVVFQSETPLTA